MQYISGRILTEKGFINGHISIKNNQYMDLSKGNSPDTPIHKGLIIPSFINFHTHIADAFIRYEKIDLPKNVNDLVAPPNGLKHQLVKKASEEKKINGIIKAINEMKSNGICLFVDFRENGIKGINILKKALLKNNINSIILSRPQSLTFNKNEVNELIQNSDGIGISSISDWSYDDLEKISQITHKNKKIFALHVSENKREDIDNVLALKPIFLVHMLKANEDDLQKVKDNKIPVVVCPRSNTFFGLKPDLSLMKKTGIQILIGTDNAMLHKPSIFEEIKHIQQINPGLFTLEELLLMSTFLPRKALNSKHIIPDFKYPTSYLVLDIETLKPIYKINTNL